MDTFQPNWLQNVTKMQEASTPRTESRLRSPSSASYPSIVPMLKGTSILTYAGDNNAAATQVSPKELEDAFQVIYQHLHEKHYLDRIIHALYTHPYGHLSMSKKTNASPDEAGMLSFTSMVRVVFPRPAELRHATKEAHDSGQDLLLLLLTEPILRFRICAIAHLLESALAFENDTWAGERPRRLSSEEMRFVMEKLQDMFRDLFHQDVAQASIRRYLTTVANWCEQMLQVDDEVSEPEFPEIVKEIFPCYDLLFQEFKNLLVVGKHDLAFQSEVHLLYKFVMISLRNEKFVKFDDWTNEGCAAIENLKKTLCSSKYRGPAQRLIRNFVSMTDQLWEGGGTTDTTLAIETILSTVIQKSLRGVDVESDHGATVTAGGGWDVMSDFERLVRAVSTNIAPLPLPSIVWRRDSSEICLDAVVIEFPNTMPRNIHLNSTMVFDKSVNKMMRQWHLKISGLEIEAKNVAYYYVTKIPLLQRLVDVGELSLKIPPESMDIEIKFSLNPPEIRCSTNTAATRHRSQEEPGKRQATAPAPRNARPGNEYHQSTIGGGNGAAGRRATTSQEQRRRFEPAVRMAEIGRAVVRTSAHIGREVTEEIAEDAISSVNLFKRLLYPNAPERNRSTGRSPHRGEHAVSGWVPSRYDISWGRPRRQLVYSQKSARMRILYRDLLENGENDQDAAGLSLPTAQIAPLYRRDNGLRPELVGSPFVDIHACSVHVRKLEVQVHDTKHPILHTLADAFLVRQLRSAIEQTVRQAIVDVVQAINNGVEEVTEFSREELRSRHGQGARHGASTQQAATQPQQQLERRYLSPQRQHESSKDNLGAIFSALPLFPNVF